MPVGHEICLFSKTSKLPLWPTQPPIQWASEFIPGVKRPGLEFNHSLPSSGEVQNEWSYTFAPHMYLHREWLYAVYFVLPSRPRIHIDCARSSAESHRSSLQAGSSWQLVKPPGARQISECFIVLEIRHNIAVCLRSCYTWGECPTYCTVWLKKTSTHIGCFTLLCFVLISV
jgi:hypothetical protein